MIAAVAPKPLTTDEAATLLERLGSTVDRLVAIMEMETSCIRAGDLRGAAALVPEKATLAGQYQREVEAVRMRAGEIGDLAPLTAMQTRTKLAALQEALAVNISVVATARGIIEEIARPR